MEWNVFIYDTDQGQITSYNIFDNIEFLNDVQYIGKNAGIGQFAAGLDQCLQCYFGKNGGEIIFNNLLSGRTEIDILDQISLNWKIFVNYVWDHVESKI